MRTLLRLSYLLPPRPSHRQLRRPDRVAGRPTASVQASLMAAVLAAAMSLGARPARAQAVSPPARSFDGDLFQPAIGPRNFLTLDAADVPGHEQLSFGLVFDLQRFPYKISTGRPGAKAETQYPLSTELKSELHLALGLFDRVQLGVAVPFVLAIRGDGISGDTGLTTGNDLSAAGLGDVRVEVKAQLLSAGDDDQFVLGGLVGGTAPTGKKDSYIGERSVTGRGKVLATLALGRLRLGAEAGVLLREKTVTLDASVGNQVLYAGGASLGLLRGFEVIGEVAGRSGFADFTKRYWDENPLEADIAARASPRGMVAITGGLGVGLGKGIGAPQVRLFLGAEFTPDFRDSDHDGVYDSEDRCPDQAEDRDGYKDDDGCPDLDNDGDGIPDATDKCPNDPEDFDQFEDEDGCPDPDNDKDGIPDLNDACPNAAEDGRGKRPKDGCPSTSEDQDGDGIPDGFDNCPNEPEDADGFQDEDGCPDPDNDKDGIPDTADKCPNQPETLNGIKDDDGCPDAGDEIVRLQDDRIEVLEKISFSTRHGQSDLKDSALPSLKDVALVMKGHPEITKLRIDVSSEKLSADEAKHRAELIRDALVAVGVESKRLRPTGKAEGGSGTHVSFVIVEKAAAKPLTPSAPPPKAAPAIP